MGTDGKSMDKVVTNFRRFEKKYKAVATGTACFAVGFESDQDFYRCQ